MATMVTRAGQINGLDVDALKGVMHEIEQDPAKGQVEFRVRSEWKGQTRSRTTVDSYSIGGQTVHRHFSIDADEPFELLGRNTAPNPQELLMTALNACITVGYVAGASMKGIALEKVEIETSGRLDLRGFLGLDPAVPAGYDTIHYVVRIKGAGTPEQFREIHETVAKTSPNYFNLSRPITIDARLVVE
ncbi:MAG TPA: OsmC family protein [Methylomirabilota bacterium]|nr:OsmC family protein [Methylomirabilota bacterium]